jgi:hypothetical protein
LEDTLQYLLALKTVSTSSMSDSFFKDFAVFLINTIFIVCQAVFIVYAV